MKNTTFIGFVLVAFTALISCRKENTTKSKNSVLENSVLLSDLVQVNVDLAVELSHSTKANGRGLRIALADLGGAYAGGKAGAELGLEIGVCLGNPLTGGAFGAAIGALGVGAYASWESSQSISKASENQFDNNMLYSLCEIALQKKDYSDLPVEMREKLFVDKDVLDNTNLDDESKRIGLLHNVVLAGLREDIVLGPLPQTKSSESSSLELEILHSPQMKNLLSSCSGRENTLEASLSDSVLKLFNTIFEECSGGCQDVSTVINKYQSVIIDSGELTTEEKNNLSLAFATALYSANFWTE